MSYLAHIIFVKFDLDMRKLDLKIEKLVNTRLEKKLISFKNITLL